MSTQIPAGTAEPEEDQDIPRYADGSPVQIPEGGVSLTEEESDTDAGAEEKTGGEAPTEPPPEDEAVTPDPEILSQEDFEAVKNDPQKLIKLLNKGFTEARQRDSAALRQSQADADIGRRIREDPVGSTRELIALARARGIDLGDAPAKTETPSSPKDDPYYQQLVESIGEDAADKAWPAIQGSIDARIKAAMGPVQDQLSVSRAAAARQEGQAALKQLAEKYPDYKNFEGKMTELMRTVHPGEMRPFEYMETLYKLASYGKPGKAGTMVEKVVERMSSAAAGAGKPNGGVSRSSVRSTSLNGKIPTLREAFEAAVRGEVFTDED